MLKKIEKDELFEKMVTGVRDEFKTAPQSQSVKKRPALGKGLSSLMGLSEVPVKETKAVSPERVETSEKAAKGDSAAESKNSLKLGGSKSHEAAKELEPTQEIRQAKELNFAGEPETAEKIAESTLPSSISTENVVLNTESVGVNSAELNGERFEYLPVRSVIANPLQPRRRFVEEDLNSLASSIKESGVIQPIIVRQVEKNVFEIVAGERRFRAAKRAGLESVPAVVKDLDEQATLELSIVENVQRADLNPVEEAVAYKRLSDEFSLNQEQIAKTVGKDRVSIANSMRLLGLEDEVLELLAEGKLSAGHGRALLMKEAGRDRLVLALKVVKEGLSVRATEALTKQSSKVVSSVKASPYAKDIEASLRRSLGTKVKVKISQSGAGEIKLSFFSPEELDGLLEKLS